jgi:hypothetical protein
MTYVYACFEPTQGLLRVGAEGIASGAYLIWVDDIIVARVQSRELLRGVTLAPTWHLRAPSAVRLQSIGSTPEIEGFVWLSQATASQRLTLWSKGRNAARRTLMFLATDQRPTAFRQLRVIAEIRRQFGAFFDSFGVLLLTDDREALWFDPTQTIDLQGRLDVTGLAREDIISVIHAHFRSDPAVACAPLDAAATAIIASLEGMPLLAGPWLSNRIEPARSGVAWKTVGLHEALSFTISEHWMELSVPPSRAARLDARLVLHRWLGDDLEEALPASELTCVIARLRERRESVTILMARGLSRGALSESLPHARFTSLEMASSGNRRMGMEIEPFSWAALQGRTLVYLGRDQALDELLAALCSDQGLPYASAFTNLTCTAQSTVGAL